MKHIRRIIQLHLGSELSIRKIAQALSIPRSTVDDYIQRFKASSLRLQDVKMYSDRFIYRALFPEKRKYREGKKFLPNFPRIHNELKKKHVTRLWSGKSIGKYILSVMAIPSSMCIPVG